MRPGAGETPCSGQEDLWCQAEGGRVWRQRAHGKGRREAGQMAGFHLHPNLGGLSPEGCRLGVPPSPAAPRSVRPSVCKGQCQWA